MININTENGAVMHYSGESSKFIKELLTYETTPKVTKEEALEIYRDAIRVKLEWSIDHDVEETVYQLLYKQITVKIITNSSTVVEKFVILMRILGRKFGASKITLLFL